MTFQEYLAELPLDDLKLIASTLRISPGLISRARLLREIPEQMLQPGFLESWIDTLDQSVQDTLLAVLITGDRGYACDLKATGDPSLQDRLHTLLTCGVIMGRRGPLFASEYLVPVDLRERLNRRLAQRLSRRLSAQIPPPAADEFQVLTFIRDLFSFLTGLRREPPRLTDRGILYKRAMETILSGFEVKDGSVPLTPNGYPDRLDLMIGYARSRRLIYQEEDRLRLSAAFEQWLHLPTTEKADDLLAFWYSRNNALSFRVGSLLGILQICLDLENINMEAMTDLVLACTPGLSRREAAMTHNREWVAKALRDMEWLGLIRRYEDASGAAVELSATPLGRNVLGNRRWEEDGLWSDRFVVQPTYEIIAPRGLHLTIRNELERFSDLVAVDVTLTFRITGDTVYRAGDVGMSGEAIIAFLERHSEKTVPQNVEYSIREWGDSYGQVYFMDVFLLRTADAEMASHIEAHRELAPFVLGQVAPDALIVERHAYREMMDILRKAGFMPRSQVIGLEPDNEKARLVFARERFADVWTRHGVHRTTSSAIIGFDECLPGYRLRQRMSSRQEDTTHLEPSEVMMYLSPRHTEELLLIAIADYRLVLIDYYAGNRSNSQMFKIRPLRIERTRGIPYVEAQRIWEQDMRAFKVANIKAIRIVYDDEKQEEARSVT